MSYLIIGLLVVATAHFVYESILAPSLRLRLRFELFSLRDELRDLGMGGQAALDDRQFEYLQDSLNLLISVLDRFDGTTLIAVEKELRRNPLLRAQTEMRLSVVERCENLRARSIRAQCVRIAAQALAVNHGGACLYVLPLALPSLGYSRLRRLIAASLSLSDARLAKVAPLERGGVLSA
jgi:hypothetical protein